ncbi:MAG: hypothetical protein V2A70_01075 [Candidatus Omnitrophota bacterium]
MNNTRPLTQVLTAMTLAPGALTAAQRQRMLHILKIYFNGMDADAFRVDLDEKDAVILLTEEVSGEIRGFSTQKFISTHVDGQPVQAIFSGDTIVEKEYWRQTILVKAWFKLVLTRLTVCPDVPLYWFLICMGYKTYRFLPVYFKSYYPSVELAGTGEKRIMDVLAQSRFGSQYDATKGIIRFTQHGASLKNSFAGIPAGKEADAHVRLFLEKNPGYLHGDELACLAKLHPSNFKKAVFRFTQELEFPG